MYKYSLLIISIFLFLFGLIGFILGIGCNVWGVRDWRGDKAGMLGIVFPLIFIPALFGVISQIIKFVLTPGAKLGALAFFGFVAIVLVFVSVVFTKVVCS